MMIWRKINKVTFGMLEKKCDENISTKTSLNCNSEKWESYYSKLFKGYNDLDNNRNTSLKIQEEYLIRAWSLLIN